MKELVPMFEDVGCQNVRTYIQSGNVVFEANSTLAGNIPTLIPEAIEKKCKIKVPVVVRSEKEIRAVARNNSFLKDGAEEKHLHVAFLVQKPLKKAVGELDPDRSPGDEYVVQKKEIYLHCPNGMARTKLTTSYFDSKLKNTCTVRTWKTVMKLLKMVDGG
jgi:uncharacterized protein (DUF1697 family)